MKLDEMLDIDKFNELVRDGYITVRAHQNGMLSIANYTSAAAYENVWTPETLQSRGLIYSTDTLEIKARPWGKFFNFTEKVPDQIIHGKFCVATEKADGSLGIIYPNHSGGYDVATRGSFHSDQADWASNWLIDNMPDFTQPEGVTTLVEIIYKENRIVLDYGDFEGLVLLGAIDNATGADIPIWDIDWWYGERVKVYHDIKDVESGYKLATSSDFSDQEGLVMTWYKFNEPSFRLKVKHAEYIRLHGIIHNFSKKRVWEALVGEINFLGLLDDVPDEFYNMVHSVVEDLKGKFRAIEKAALEDYHGIAAISDRKQFALRAQDSEYRAILFMMLDGRDYSKTIWKMIEPRGDE